MILVSVGLAQRISYVGQLEDGLKATASWLTIDEQATSIILLIPFVYLFSQPLCTRSWQDCLLITSMSPPPSNHFLLPDSVISMPKARLHGIASYQKIDCPETIARISVCMSHEHLINLDEYKIRAMGPSFIG